MSATLMSTNQLHLSFLENLLKVSIFLGSEIIETIRQTGLISQDLEKKIQNFNRNMQFLCSSASLCFDQTARGREVTGTYHHIYLAVYLFKQIKLLDDSLNYHLKELSSKQVKNIKKAFNTNTNISKFVALTGDIMQKKIPFKVKEEHCLELSKCILSPVDYQISYTDSTASHSVTQVIYLELQGETHYVYCKNHKQELAQQPNMKTLVKRQLWELGLYFDQMPSDTISKEDFLSITPQSTPSVATVSPTVTHQIYFMEIHNHTFYEWANSQMSYEHSTQGFHALVESLKSQAHHCCEISALKHDFQLVQESLTQPLPIEAINTESSVDDKEPVH